METHIRKFKFETIDELKSVINNIKRREETIHRLRTEKQPFPVNALIERNKKELAEFNQQKNLLEKKVNDIDIGLYDDFIREQIETNMKVVSEKSKITQRKKTESKNTLMNGKTAKTTKQQPKFKTKNYEPSTRDIEYEEKNYLKNCSSLPDYMHDKLRNMTNDCGYIWRDIWFFGLKPVESRSNNRLTLFEKVDGKFYTHIYETYPSKGIRIHSIFIKDKNGRKQLVEKHTKNLTN